MATRVDIYEPDVNTIFDNDIEVGEMFAVGDKVFIKTKTFYYYKDPIAQTGKRYNAIRVDTGEFYYFSFDHYVTPVNATITVYKDYRETKSCKS